MATGLPQFLPRMIMKGEKGRDVLAVQQALIANGYKVKADGVFGGGTQVALRSFQMHKGLLPSGVIDQETIDCLYAKSESAGNAGIRLKKGQSPEIWLQGSSAMGLAPAFWGKSFAPRALNISINGFDFIYGVETRKGTSEYLHFPGGDSGVTLGPGYDMKEREQPDVERDLLAIGIPKVIANAWSLGAKIHVKSDIQSFIAANKNSYTLSTDQQKQLLKIPLPEKEALVRHWVTIDLFQFENDALVSVAYNPGGLFPPIARHINSGKPEKAMKIIASRIHSGSILMKGLIDRRRKEIALYTHGRYC